MAKTKASETAIGILGMHRSGTSLVTRVVNLLGAYLGEDADMMQARADNPEGFWEHRRVYAFHERLLECLGRSWDTAIPLVPDWQKAPEIAPFRDELRELIETHFEGRPIWAWKDPRACILLPLWRDVLAELDIALSCLLVTRNPLDVARSLAARNEFSLHDGFGLWFNHSLAMLQNSAGLPRCVVSYSKFLSNPQASIDTWAPRLSLTWPQQDEALPDLLAQVVRKDLCHSVSTLKDLTQAGCPKPVIELARLLNAMAKTGDAEGSAEGRKIARLFDDHWSQSSLYSHDFIRTRSANDELRRQLEEQEVKARDARASAEQQQRDVAELQTQVNETQQRLALGQEQCEMIEQQLGEREKALAASRAQKESVEQQLAKRDQALLKSRATNKAIEQELANVRNKCGAIEQGLEERLQELTRAYGENEAAVKQLEDHRQELAKARSDCENFEATIRHNEQVLAADREKRQVLMRQLQQKEREVLDKSTQVASYEQKLESAQALLERLKRTYSWRVTAPLRAVLDFYKSIF